MQTAVICILSESPSWLKEVQQNYGQKIKPFGAFEIKEIKPKKHGRGQADFKKNAESELILDQIKDQDLVVLLDEKGKDLDSIQFSQKMARWQNSGKKRLVFVIGGAYGVSEDVKVRAQESIRLSSLTFNHWMAQAVLLEQIYRAHAILKGLPYHNS
jgi:23S rRNA (pseudouridine1915-N3)-methyltransferase